MEEKILNELIEKEMPVRVIHTTGYQQNCVILEHDSKALLISVKGQSKLVYKHGVSTIELA